MYGRIERAALTAKTATSSSSLAYAGAFKDRPAYYKVPSQMISHLHLEMPQLRVKNINCPPTPSLTFYVLYSIFYLPTDFLIILTILSIADLREENMLTEPIFNVHR